MMKRNSSGHLPHMVEKYCKILLSFGMEMGRPPRTNQPTGRKDLKRTHDDLESLFDDEDSAMAVGMSLLCPTSTSDPFIPRPA